MSFTRILIVTYIIVSLSMLTVRVEEIRNNLNATDVEICSGVRGPVGVPHGAR